MGTPPAVILIDDDALIRMSWKFYAKSRGTTLHAFTSVAEFLASPLSQELPRETPVYCDSQLGSESGEVASEAIAQLGYGEIYLATGREPGSIVKPAWIREIVGKEPGF